MSDPEYSKKARNLNLGLLILVCIMTIVDLYRAYLDREYFKSVPYAINIIVDIAVVISAGILYGKSRKSSSNTSVDSYTKTEYALIYILYILVIGSHIYDYYVYHKGVSLKGYIKPNMRSQSY